MTFRMRCRRARFTGISVRGDMMIVDLYLKKIVEESGRREITSSMVRDARKAKRDDFYSTIVPFQNQGLRQEQRMAIQQRLCRYDYGLGGLGSLLGGALGYNQRCSYCGK